jgi:hypothetical protein
MSLFIVNRFKILNYIYEGTVVACDKLTNIFKKKWLLGEGMLESNPTTP